MDNRGLNIKEMVEGKTVLASNPPLIYVELTQRCNCACLMCYRSRPEFMEIDHENADMKRSIYEHIAQKLFKTAELVDLRGFGEPTIYPDIRNILDYNRRHFPDIKYKLISNGKSMDAGLMKSMAELDLDLYISFDAADKGLFEQLRKGNSYDDVVENIKKWNRVFSKKNRTRLLVTLHKYNADKMADIARFAVANECRLLSISEVDPLTGAEWIAPHNVATLDIKKCLSICASAGIDIVLPADYRNSITLDKSWKLVAIEKCTAPYNTVLFKYNGDVYTCSHRFGNMGNITCKPFKEIWNGKRFKSLRSGDKGWDNLCSGCNRNSLAYIGTRGIIREKTWQLIEKQQTKLKVLRYGSQ